jgi:hypothetical protein
MFLNQRLAIIGFLLMFVLWIPEFAFSGGDRLPECNEKWCFLVAQPPSKWPSYSVQHSFPLEEKPGISILIPEGFEKIYRVSNLLIFSYNNKKADISFEEMSRATIPELSKYTCMSVKDVAHVIFTKTPKDRDHGCLALWQWAMCSKSVYFRRGVPVFTIKKLNITVYYRMSKDKFDPSKIENLAVIINEKHPESFVVMRTVGFSFDKFKNMIGSIEETYRGR